MKIYAVVLDNFSQGQHVWSEKVPVLNPAEPCTEEKSWTNRNLSDRYDLNQPSTVPLIPIMCSNVCKERLWLGLSRSDHVIGNRARSRGFRLDRNRMLHPDHVSDIYFILTILISTIYFKLIITHNIPFLRRRRALPRPTSSPSAPSEREGRWRGRRGDEAKEGGELARSGGVS